MPCACDPAIMVNGSVTKHLEVLGCMTVLSSCIIEGINHLRPIERELLGAIHHLWKRQTGCFQYSRSNIHNVTKLRPNLSFGFDMLGPMHYHSVAGTAPMRSNLLGHLKRRIQAF